MFRIEYSLDLQHVARRTPSGTTAACRVAQPAYNMLRGYLAHIAAVRSIPPVDSNALVRLIADWPSDFVQRKDVAHGSRFAFTATGLDRLNKFPAHKRNASFKKMVFEIASALNGEEILFEFMGAGDVFDLLSSVRAHLADLPGDAANREIAYDPLRECLPSIRCALRELHRSCGR